MSHRFPRIYNYADACRVEERIKPLASGCNKGSKPLAERRRTSLTIRKVCDDVVVRLYQTDIITYKPDGCIVVEQGGWNTPSTHEVVGRVIGTSIFVRHGIGWIECANGTYPLRNAGANVFKRESGLVYVNPAYPRVHKVNVAKRNIVTKQYEQFTQYALGLVKVLGDACVHNEDVFHAECGRPRNVHDMTAMMLDEEQHYRAWLHVLKHADMQRGNGSSWGYRPPVPFGVEAIKESLKEILYVAHAPQIFDMVEVTSGKVVQDPNRKYAAAYAAG